MTTLKEVQVRILLSQILECLSVAVIEGNLQIVGSITERLGAVMPDLNLVDHRDKLTEILVTLRRDFG